MSSFFYQSTLCIPLPFIIPLVFFPQRNPNIRMENIKLLLIVKALFFFI